MGTTAPVEVRVTPSVLALVADCYLLLPAPFPLGRVAVTGQTLAVSQTVR